MIQSHQSQLERMDTQTRLERIERNQQEQQFAALRKYRQDQQNQEIISQPFHSRSNNDFSPTTVFFLIALAVVVTIIGTSLTRKNNNGLHRN